MTSRPVRICFCQESARSWLEFGIDFSQYCSMRSFQRALVGFDKLWIHFIFIYFNCPSVWNSKITSQPFQMESWAQCLGSCIFSCSRGNCIFFNFFFDILEQYKFGLCITAWRQRSGFWLYFYLSKRVSLCSRYGFYANLQLFCSIWSHRE